MSRIEKRFADLKSENRKALIPYITAGDPTPAFTVPTMHAFVEAGADLIELGVPFSDPMADGPVIQLACERALRHNTSLTDVLEMVRTFRQDDKETPVVLMGYLNPVEVMGYETFAKNASAAGVDGILLVDLPPEEARGTVEMFSENKLDSIFLVAPTTVDSRLENIASHARGFMYYVSLKGVTGAANLNVDEVRDKVSHIKQFTDLPVGVGFGIKDAASAALVAKVADAVVVGSALIRKVEGLQDQPDQLRNDMAALLAEMRKAIDAG